MTEEREHDDEVPPDSEDLPEDVKSGDRSPDEEPAE